MQVDSLLPYNSGGEELVVVFFFSLGPRYAKALLLVSVRLWKFVAVFSCLSVCLSPSMSVYLLLYVTMKVVLK